MHRIDEPSGTETNQSPETALATKKQPAARYRVCIRPAPRSAVRQRFGHGQARVAGRDIERAISRFRRGAMQICTMLDGNDQPVDLFQSAPRSCERSDDAARSKPGRAGLLNVAVDLFVDFMSFDGAQRIAGLGMLGNRRGKWSERAHARCQGGWGQACAATGTGRPSYGNRRN
ncbi:MAG: hypothetical protein ACREFR_08820 [Limisphaerales bacterium]